MMSPTFSKSFCFFQSRSSRASVHSRSSWLSEPHGRPSRPRAPTRRAGDVAVMLRKSRSNALALSSDGTTRVFVGRARSTRSAAPSSLMADRALHESSLAFISDVRLQDPNSPLAVAPHESSVLLVASPSPSCDGRFARSSTDWCCARCRETWIRVGYPRYVVAGTRVARASIQLSNGFICRLCGAWKDRAAPPSLRRFPCDAPEGDPPTQGTPRPDEG